MQISLFSSLTDDSNVSKTKKSIWGEKKNDPAGVVHGLVLMLLAVDLVKPRLVSKDKVGTSDVKMKDVELILCQQIHHTSSINMLSIHDNFKWKQFNVSDST